MVDKVEIARGNVRPSRRDVAIAAGVSLTTVTHAFSDTPGTRVNEATKSRVKRIAREMGYKPNFVGKALSSGRNFAVGLLQPSFDSISYTYYQEIISGFAEAMDCDDYNILSLYRKGDFRYMRAIEQRRVDGVAILQSDFDMSHIDRIMGSGMPVVVINKDLGDRCAANAGCVIPDYAGFMESVVSDFTQAGCKTILAFSDYSKAEANSLMRRCFMEALGRRSSMGVSGEMVIPANPRDGSFRRQCLELFRTGRRWSGIFVDNSWRGSFLVSAARECGLEAGRDFCLITTETCAGPHDTSEADFAFYSQQGHLMGVKAWEILFAFINGGECVSRAFVPYKRELLNPYPKGWRE